MSADTSHPGEPGPCRTAVKWLLVWLWALASPLTAAAGLQTVDELWDRSDPFALRLVSRTDDPQKAAQAGYFSAPLLEAYVLVEFSDWSLTRPGQAPLQLQVYQMLDTPAALGLFSSTQQVWAENGRRREWPLDAATNQRLLAFWRGPFFFLIEASGDDLPLGELEDWAQRVARRVTHPTVYPMTVVQLPEEGLERDSIRFYLSEEALAGHPAFPRSLLGGIDFDQGGEVTAARYRPSGLTLFLIGYPTASLAEEHFASLQKRLESVFSEQGIFLKRSGLLISMVEAPELDARAILDRVRYTATIKWIYEKDTALEDARQRREELVGFFGIVTASILFTGVFILVALTAGALLGLLRYHLLQRYPHLGAKGEMIRLDLDRLKPS